MSLKTPNEQGEDPTNFDWKVAIGKAGKVALTALKFKDKEEEEIFILTKTSDGIRVGSLGAYWSVSFSEWALYQQTIKNDLGVIQKLWAKRSPNRSHPTGEELDWAIDCEIAAQLHGRARKRQWRKVENKSYMVKCWATDCIHKDEWDLFPASIDWEDSTQNEFDNLDRIFSETSILSSDKPNGHKERTYLPEDRARKAQ
ncbi:MAG: hypothetical protein KC931_10050 [Candidatus Omnitrophica bacterium]|nr:hypothetical protein [Candidatus Omnitrophota bacterium]